MNKYNFFKAVLANTLQESSGSKSFEPSAVYEITGQINEYEIRVSPKHTCKRVNA